MTQAKTQHQLGYMMTTNKPLFYLQEAHKLAHLLQEVKFFPARHTFCLRPTCYGQVSDNAFVASNANGNLHNDDFYKNNTWLSNALGNIWQNMCGILHRFFNRCAKLNTPKIRIAAMASVVLLSPKTLTPLDAISALDKVMLSKTLTVAQTKNGDDYLHQLGMDAARRFAEHLGVSVKIATYNNEVSAAAAMQEGKVDVLIGQNLQANAWLSCQGDVGFSFRDKNKLFGSAKRFLCDKDVSQTTQIMAQFYNNEVLHGYGRTQFDDTMSKRLSLYQKRLQNAAKRYNHDWRLLGAIAYQESHLNPNATSPTGVQGIMMLTKDTANAMGVDNRIDATQSIEGGAKYLDYLNKEFSDIDDNTRIWFVLAAYNMGPNAVRRVQEALQKEGKNPDNWSHVYAYLVQNTQQNRRYGQCAHYVSNIKSYFEALST